METSTESQSSPSWLSPWGPWVDTGVASSGLGAEWAVTKGGPAWSGPRRTEKSTHSSQEPCGIPHPTHIWEAGTRTQTWEAGTRTHD